MTLAAAPSLNTPPVVCPTLIMGFDPSSGPDQSVYVRHPRALSIGWVKLRSCSFLLVSLDIVASGLVYLWRSLCTGIYSHARWSYRRRFRSLLLCPLSVERHKLHSLVECSYHIIGLAYRFIAGTLVSKGRWGFFGFFFMVLYV